MSAVSTFSCDTFDRNVLAAAAALRAAGFAVHWLHPKSKRPIGERWSESPVASLESLRSSHCAGNNIGVRLGEPSALIDGNYLHLFDIDIRIADLADEAWAKFAELLPDVRLIELPAVISGSGGESRHIYFVSDKPFRSKRLVVSEGKHRGADGKWHYDFEIELFGTGKQVVLPPSIHPDTGKPYIWEREFDLDSLALGLSPFVPSAAIERLQVAEHTNYEYESREPLTFKPGQMERDLDIIPISDLHYDDWIRLGQALHHQFGGSQEGFDLWLKHTKRSKKYTGEKQDREMRRIKWRSFGKYRGQPVTMATVRQWAADARQAELLDQFDDEPEAFDDTEFHSSPGTADSPGNAPKNTEFLSDEFDDLIGGDMPAAEEVDDIEAALGEAMAPATRGLPWTSLLDLNAEGAIKPTLHNVELIIRNDPRSAGLPQFNAFTQETVQRTPPGRKLARANAPKEAKQLDGPVWLVRDPINGDLWGDEKDNSLRAVIEAPRTQGGYGIKVADRDLKAAVDMVARHNTFHPVREYLEGLVWDRQPRVETFLIRYLGAADTSYTRAVARLTLLGAVTRIFEPAAKFDFVTILEGLQGKRKSTFISLLARNWFAELEGNFSDRKALVEKMQGSWILEIPELSGFTRAEVTDLKAFVSATTDKVRLAYARRAKEFQRQCIFVGSTNEEEYLKDNTGGRRFWPVHCAVEQIDTDAFAEEVDQLWAEAVSLYRGMRENQPSGTLPLFLKDEEARSEAEGLQESRRIETVQDAYAGQIGAWLEKPVVSGALDDDSTQPARREVTCLAEIWVECLGRDIGAYNNAHAQGLSRAIRLVPGWRFRGRGDHGNYGRQRLYERV